MLTKESFLKKTFALFLLIFSFQSFGMEIMTVKERLRLSLWFDGLESNEVAKKPSPQKIVLPEELEKVLKKS
jgi:hypothetical protein